MRPRDPRQLDRLLTDAADALDRCAQFLSETEYNLDRGNIRKIGLALREVFEIQLQIWDERPDLRPEGTESWKRWQMDDVDE